MLIGGAVAGIGGSFFTLVSVDAFSKDMSGGRGYIALAALIFGRWNPIGAFLAALLFGFADNLQSIITIIGSPVPSQFMAMLPYALTIFAVAGLVGRPGRRPRTAYRTSREHGAQGAGEGYDDDGRPGVGGRPALTAAERAGRWRTAADVRHAGGMSPIDWEALAEAATRPWSMPMRRIRSSRSAPRP